MEELQCKKIPRKGYRSHLTHLIKKVDAIMDSESRPSEKDFTTLTNSIEKLNECATLLKEVDQEIASTIAGEDELEAEIIESAAIQEAISDKISQVKRTINILTMSLPTPLSMSAPEFMPSHHPTVATPATTTTPSVSRLTKLSLPTFYGNPLPGIVTGTPLRNSTLDGVQKFNYLRAQIQGEASREIARLPLTSTKQ